MFTGGATSSLSKNHVFQESPVWFGCLVGWVGMPARDVGSLLCCFQPETLFIAFFAGKHILLARTNLSMFLLAGKDQFSNEWFLLARATCSMCFAGKDPFFNAFFLLARINCSMLSCWQGLIGQGLSPGKDHSFIVLLARTNCFQCLLFGWQGPNLQCFFSFAGKDRIFRVFCLDGKDRFVNVILPAGKDQFVNVLLFMLARTN